MVKWFVLFFVLVGVVFVSGQVGNMSSSGSNIVDEQTCSWLDRGIIGNAECLIVGGCDSCLSKEQLDRANSLGYKVFFMDNVTASHIKTGSDMPDSTSKELVQATADLDNSISNFYSLLKYYHSVFVLVLELFMCLFFVLEFWFVGWVLTSFIPFVLIKVRDLLFKGMSRYSK